MPDSRATRILIVEDSVTQATRLAELLSKRGYVTRIAGDGLIGLELARQEPPDLVISDISMPRMDGFALCAELRRDPVLRELPVILLTALDSLYDVIRSLDCGADNFIRKPFDERYLLDRIRVILANRALRGEERVQFGMRVQLGGQTHFITAERQQIFDLLMSTYEEAIHMTEQLREQQQRISSSYRALVGLYGIAEALSPVLTEAQVAAVALERMLGLPGVVCGLVALKDPTGVPYVAAAHGLPAQPGAPLCEADCACLAPGADLTGPRAPCAVLAPVLGSRPLLTVRLSTGGRVLGCAQLGVSAEGLSRDDQQVLATAARLIATALERARLYADMEAQVRLRSADLLAERNLLSAVVRNAGALVLMVDTEGRVVLFNPACERALGWRREEVEGKPFWELFPPPQEMEATRALFLASHDADMTAQTDRAWRARDGSTRRILWTIATVRDAQDKVAYRLGTGVDVTELETVKEQLNYLNSHDPVSGLPNRRRLRELLDQMLATEQGAALLLVRCERLPLIRERLGVAAEQAAVAEMTRRLVRWKQRDDRLGRLDEQSFALLCAPSEPHQLAQQAHAVIALLDRPAEHAQEELHVGAAVGIALAPADGGDLEELAQAAQTAVRQAADALQDRVTFYHPELGRGASERYRLEAALRHALERDELEVHYQPQLDMRSGRMIGMEALLRWHHPDWGVVSPGTFIGLAEQTGLIIPIGEWVLHETCQQIHRWRDAGLPVVPVAVNLSARQFGNGIEEKVLAALDASGIEPALLELELTESVSMQDPEYTVRLMDALKNHGVGLAIDDFGTGYSNLNYLKRFPVDKLKFDQSFVRELATSPDDQAIMRAVIAMAHGLRLRVLAEGVETRGQFAILARHGCDEMQGYLFSRPLTASAAAALLQTGAALAVEPPAGGPAAVLVLAPPPELLPSLQAAARVRGMELRQCAEADLFECLAMGDIGLLLTTGPAAESVCERVRALYPQLACTQLVPPYEDAGLGAALAF